MEKTGLVIESSNGNALIEFDRESACHESCKGCGACDAAGKTVRIEAPNLIGARAGDHVLVEMSTHAFALATVILYVAPLAAFMAALLIANALGLPDLWQGALAIGAAGLVLLVIRLLEAKIRLKKSFVPRIVRVTELHNNQK